MEALLDGFKTSLGLGQLPGLTQENQDLNEELIARQVEISRIESENGDQESTVNQIFGHFNNVQEALAESKNVKVAKKENIASEKNLLR